MKETTGETVAYVGGNLKIRICCTDRQMGRLPDDLECDDGPLTLTVSVYMEPRVQQTLRTM
jgi:hypothetical protein